MGNRAQRVTEIARQRADIGTRSAVDTDRQHRRGVVEDRQLEDVDRSHGWIESDTGPGQIVQSASFDLNGRMPRRDLFSSANPVGKRGFDVRQPGDQRCRSDQHAISIEGIGRDAEGYLSAIGFRAVRGERQGSGRHTKSDRQHARGGGIECARVPDRALASQASDPADNIVTGQPRRFVDWEKTVKSRSIRTRHTQATGRRATRSATVFRK